MVNVQLDAYQHILYSKNLTLFQVHVYQLVLLGKNMETIVIYSMKMTETKEHGEMHQILVELMEPNLLLLLMSKKMISYKVSFFYE